ncbi:MAG: PVC-type heme-binding CxxCH protein [Planctomycetota bacterium]|nr:PVC-type heme-binding CxxCH protein [Planctomycetota bacterium]
MSKNENTLVGRQDFLHPNPVENRTVDRLKSSVACLIVLSAILQFMVVVPAVAEDRLSLKHGSRLVLLGNGLGSRMGRFGHFETELHRRYPDSELFIRNMCDEGNTPAFRPHSGRNSPFPFPGAEQFRTLKNAKDRWSSGHTGNGFYETPDQWLKRLKPDVIVAFFGYNESFGGVAGLDSFISELTAFVRHTKSQKYNGRTVPKLALVSPIAFQDLSRLHGTPDGKLQNANLASYTAAMEKVAREQGVVFADVFSPTAEWFASDSIPWTRDGALLLGKGYQRLAPVLADALFGEKEVAGDWPTLNARVMEKNWMWHQFYKVPNGVHVYGRRHRPYGPKNYPHERIKVEQLVANRDQAIWKTLQGRDFDLAAADGATHPLPVIGQVDKRIRYLSGQDSISSFQLPEGYRIELFASEQDFANLANPSQMSFDNQGRLWVSVMPTYPHYQPGDLKPDDKLLILEDTNGDGKADKETVFCDRLHLPLGFEFAPEGVYVAQSNELILLRDTDGDDRADQREIVLAGFDDHDTHHAISAFCADPSGAIIMGEGTFLHSHIETAYGPVRSSNGGYFRYEPSRRRLQRHARLSLPNPWGTAFDRWGQCFFADTSDPNMRWMLPGTMQVEYGDFAPLPRDLLERHARVRPTSGLEFISSRHFPDEVQGDILINNVIGFQGTKQHQMLESGTGYAASFRQDLLTSSDRNFRPVDMEFAPDGSLYMIDWHNALIGHMQHNARDVNRDHAHGRVYRVTYPARPLVKPAKVSGASISELLGNLKLHEYRTRYRTRRELRGRDADQVLAATAEWVGELDASDPGHEHHLLEALWVTWGFDRADESLLRRLLSSDDHRVRAAAVEVLRFNGHRVADQASLLLKAAGDEHGRVRMGAMVAATWLGKSVGLPIMEKAGERQDEWVTPVYKASRSFFSGQPVDAVPKIDLTTHLTGRDRELFEKGAEVFSRDGHCATCHQHDGLGLTASQFPPLAQSRWVTGSPERLIKLALHGVSGPMSVRGVEYGGRVPMTAFKFLSDEDLAAALTFARNRWGNRAPAIHPETVKRVRSANEQRSRFWSVEELLADHPLLGKPIVSDVPSFSNEKLESLLLALPVSELADVAREKGDAERGKALFYKSAACFVCHDPAEGAARLGPDLNRLKKALSPEELVDSILRPSKKIEREYVQWKVLDVDGKLHVGIKVSESENGIVLRNADRPEPINLQKEDIEEMKPSNISSMPTGLVRQLKNRGEFDDLLKYLLQIGKH